MINRGNCHCSGLNTEYTEECEFEQIQILLVAGGGQQWQQSTEAEIMLILLSIFVSNW